MRNWLKTIFSIAALASIAGLTSSAYGVASFARQTGLDCSSCHSSAGYPALNSFGAAFKAGGYVMGNEENMIGDGEALSIPASLNVSVVTKLRAQFEPVDPTGAVKGMNAAVQFPDEWALFLAGRVGKNVGFITEYGGEGPISFKIPIVFDIGPAKLGLVAHWTDAFGPAWVFETLSTGAVRNLRPMENSKAVTAFRALASGGAEGEEQGLGLYVWHPMGFIAYTAFNNVMWLGSAATPDVINANAGHLIRAAVTPTVSGMDLAVGFQMITGEPGQGIQNSATGVDPRTKLNFMAFDFQLQGNVGIPLGLYASFGIDGAKGDVYDATGKLTVDGSVTSLGIYVDAQLIENMLNLGVGFGTKSAKLKSAVAGIDFSTTVATSDLLFVVKYNILRNLRLSVDFTLHMPEKTSASLFGVSVPATSVKRGYQIMPMLFGSF